MISIFNFYFLSFLFTTSFLIGPGIVGGYFCSHIFMDASVLFFAFICLLITTLIFFMFFIAWAGFDLVEDFEAFVLVSLISVSIGIFYSFLSSSVFLLGQKWYFLYGIVASINIIGWIILELIVRSQAISVDNTEKLIEKYMKHPFLNND